MEIMIEVFDFTKDGDRKVVYRNTVVLPSGLEFPFEQFKSVLGFLYPKKYINFIVVPPVGDLSVK